MERKIKDFEFKGLVISRIPEETKRKFQKFAKDSFCYDYGMTLAFILDEFFEYQKLKKKFFDQSNIKIYINEKEVE